MMVVSFVLISLLCLPYSCLSMFVSWETTDDFLVNNLQYVERMSAKSYEDTKGLVPLDTSYDDSLCWFFS